jgi:hypothetical protein
MLRRSPSQCKEYKILSFRELPNIIIIIMTGHTFLITFVRPLEGIFRI